MKFALDGHAGEDWEGPPDFSTGYVYTDQAAAEVAAEQWIREQVAAGTKVEFVGCYVISDERAHGDEPVVEDLYTLHDGVLRVS